MDGAKTPAHEARPASGFSNSEPEEGRGVTSETPSGTDHFERRFLTSVVSEYTVKRCHHRVLFGNPLKRVLLARDRGHIKVRHDFAGGCRFVLDLWRRNEYGTLQWRCYVCETAGPGQLLERVPFVSPGVRVLTSTRGALQSKAFLRWLYDFKHRGGDLLGCPSETFEAVHFRLHGLRTRECRVNTLNGIL